MVAVVWAAAVSAEEAEEDLAAVVAAADPGAEAAALPSAFRIWCSTATAPSGNSPIPKAGSRAAPAAAQVGSAVVAEAEAASAVVAAGAARAGAKHLP